MYICWGQLCYASSGMRTSTEAMATKAFKNGRILQSGEKWKGDLEKRNQVRKL